jgi:hypothetical protein
MSAHCFISSSCARAKIHKLNFTVSSIYTPHPPPPHPPTPPPLGPPSPVRRGLSFQSFLLLPTLPPESPPARRILSKNPVHDHALVTTNKSASLRSSTGSCHDRYTRNTQRRGRDRHKGRNRRGGRDVARGGCRLVRTPIVEQQAALSYPFRHSRRLVSAAGSDFFSLGHLDTPQEQESAPASPRRVVRVRWTAQSLRVEVSAMQRGRYQV